MTRDERARARRELILSAARELLEADGENALSVRAICRHAQLNSRYFYENFTDMDDVYVALQDEGYERLFERLRLPVDQPGVDGVTWQVTRAFEFFAEDPTWGVLLVTRKYDSPALQERRLDMRAQLLELVIGEANETLWGVEPVESRIRITAAMSAVDGIVRAWLNGELAVSAEEGAARTVDVVQHLRPYAEKPAP